MFYSSSTGAQIPRVKLLEICGADVLGGAAVSGEAERVGAARRLRLSGHSRAPSTQSASASLS